MSDQWRKELTSAEACSGCKAPLAKGDQRILSVYTHSPICLACKQAEEKRGDYADTSKSMIASCIAETGKPYGDPQGYCFHHFCPFKE